MTGFLKRLVRVALLLAPLGSWGFAQVTACSTLYGGGINTSTNPVSAGPVFTINTTTGARITNIFTPGYATAAIARHPTNNRIYFIENTADTTAARIGYYDLSTNTLVAAAGTINKGTDSGNFTRFGFNANGLGYASISSNNAVYTITISGNTATAARLGTVTGLPTGLSGDFAITQANRAWLSANGEIYRIDLNQASLPAVTIYNSNNATVNGVAFDTNGDLLTGDASQLYRINMGTLTQTTTSTTYGTTTSSSADLTNCINPALTPNLSLVKTVTPSGSVAPGTELTYTITATNSGNAVSVTTLFQDNIPANTTYVPNSTTLNGTAVTDAVGGVMPYVTASPIKSSGAQFGAGIVGTGASDAAVISFKVRVNNPLPATVTSVSNQGTVTYDSGAAGGGTVTVISTPTAGGSGGTVTTVGGRDFGDAPDTATGTAVGNYQTLASDGGPSHTITSGLRLGTAVTDEDNGTLQNTAATADDLSATDDEDSVAAFPFVGTAAAQTVTVPVTLTNTTGAAATLVGFLDFNKDGDFLDLNEVSASVTIAAGATSANVVFTTPTGLTAGTTYARFRISSTATEVTSAVGAASSGEVEDYQVTIGSPDLTIAKTHVGNFTRGSTGTYTLTVGNSGNQPTSGTVTVTDTLPAGFTVNGGASGSVTPGGSNAANWSCSSNAASPQVVTCTSTTAIAVSGSSVFTLTVNVAAGAGSSVTNSATVSGGGEATVNNGNNIANDPTTTVAPTDLTLAKAHTGSFTVGQTGTYNFTVNNTGGVASSGTITVTDTLPTGLTFVAGSVGGANGGNWSCSASGQTVTCTSSTAIAAASSSIFSFNVNVGVGTAPGTNSITNTASVSGGGDAVATNNSASDPTTVLSPNLTIAKTHTGNFTRGTTGTYSITVGNTGTAPTSGAITVTDTLPTGLTFVAGSVGGTNGGNWSCSASGQTLTCTSVTAIPTSGSSVFTFNVNVAATTADSVTNTATVSGANEATANNTNNTANDPTTTVGTPDLTIDKSHTDTFIRGSSGTYTFVVGNSGSVATSGTLTLTDTLPANFTVNGGASGSVTPGGSNAANWSCSSNAASPQVVTCTSTTAVAAGGSSTLSLSVNVGAAAAANVNNTASVAGGGELAANTGNNSDTDPTTTVSAADLTLAKTHTGNFTVGSTGTYSFTVTNGGETSSTGTITLTDTLPTGLTYAGSVGGTNGANWACSASGQTVTCTSSAVIAAASSSTFTFNVAVGTSTAPGTNSVTNTATVSGGGDSNTTNNTASDPTTILSPNLTISKTHTPTSFIRGSTGTYTLTVGNTGTAATSGTITVTDTLPSGLSVPAGSLTLSGANAAAWSCSASAQTITCTSTTPIPVSGNSVFSFSVTVDAGAGSSVTNIVSVAGGNEATANAGNNTASDLTPTVTPADLTLAKAHTGNFTVGQQGTYSLTVTNGGGSATSGTITVTDTLPAGLTFVAGSVGGANGGVWTCSASGQTVTCTSSTVIPITTGSNTSTFTFGVSVGTSTAVPTVTNTASVVGGGDVTSANSNGDLTTILSPNLTLAKTHTPATFVRGTQGTYTLSVGNSGTAPTSGPITVTDTLPTGVSLPAGAVTLSGANAAVWSCTASGQTVTCTSTAAVPVGGTSVFSFSVDVAANAAATVTNTAAVTGGSEATANAGNNAASDDTPTATPTDLTLAKTASGPFVQGSTGSYTLTVSNGGGTPTSGTITVTDTLPTGLSYSAASGSGWNCSASGQTVTCTTSSAVTAGGSAPPITLTVNVLTGAPATITNTATVSGGGDTTPANNSGSVSTSVTAVDLTLSKSHTGSFTVGSTGTYALSVTNSGTASSSGTITVTDTLPAGLTVNGGAAGSVTLAGTDAANWSCSSNAASPQVVTCTSNTVISAGSSSLFGFSVDVGVGTTPGTNSITNTAAVSGGGDANTGNNSASDPTTVLSPNLTIAKTHSGDFVRGTTGTYTITLGNSGTAPTSGILTVTDTLPTGLSVPAGSVLLTGTNAAAWSCSASGQTITCTSTAAIAVAGSSVFSFSVNVLASAPDSVTNTATVTGGNEATANAGNNTANDLTATVGSADLTLSKTASSTFVRGSTGTYSLTVTNSGDAASSGTITVTDVLPTGLSYSGFSGAGWSCSASGQTVTCTTSSVLAVGATSAVELTVNIATTAPTSIDNTATVAGGGELNTGNNSSTVATPTVNAGSLVLSKTVRNITQSGTSGTANQGGPGDVLEYCISYSNPGQSQVTSAVMNDTIPLSTTAETAVADYAGAAIRWRVTAPTSSTQNLSAAVADDAGELSAALTVRLGTIPANGAGDVCFRVSIDDQ